MVKFWHRALDSQISEISLLNYTLAPRTCISCISCIGTSPEHQQQIATDYRISKIASYFSHTYLLEYPEYGIVVCVVEFWNMAQYSISSFFYTCAPRCFFNLKPRLREGNTNTSQPQPAQAPRPSRESSAKHGAKLPGHVPDNHADHRPCPRRAGTR